MKDSGIYQIEHPTTGKRYVGSSERLEYRLKRHREDLLYKTHHSIKLQRAWEKYGRDAFTFSVLFYCEPQDLLFYEQRAIDIYDAVSAGYNVCPIAGSCAGVKHTPETCVKRSAALRKRPPPSLETRAKISAANKLQNHSLESIEKGAAKLRGRKLSADHIEKMVKGMTGTTRTLEQRVYMSSRNVQHALTDDEVREIRILLRQGLSKTEIGKRYNVHRVTIYGIEIGKNYKYVK